MSQAFCYNAVFFTYALILHALLPYPVGRYRLIHAAIRHRQFSRTAASWGAYSTHSAAEHDNRNLCDFG